MNKVTGMIISVDGIEITIMDSDRNTHKVWDVDGEMPRALPGQTWTVVFGINKIVTSATYVKG